MKIDSPRFFPLIDQPILPSFTYSLFLDRIPFVHQVTVVRSKVGIIVRTDAGEIAESLEIGSAIQIPIIEGQDKPKALPT